MLHYNMMRKYTLALLSTFNDIEVEYLAGDGVSTISKKIPIKFSSREKATILDSQTTQQLLSGNTNVLPRMSLVLSTIVKAEQRTTNKFTKHNVKEVNDDLTYNYNAVPYEFTYELVIQCRGMNEASMIIEQIAPRFNPNYTVRINEIPNSDEATSIPVSLLDISVETEEYEDISSNIVTLSMGLSLKGNFYPPLKTTPKVKNLQIFNNIWPTDEFQRSSLLEWDVVAGMTTATSTTTQFYPLGGVPPTITGVNISSQDINNGDIVDLTVQFTDKDNLAIDGGWTYVWIVASGDASITTGSQTVQLTVNDITQAPIYVQVVVIDPHGNQNTFIAQIVDDPGINGILLEDGTTLLTENAQYTFIE